MNRLLVTMKNNTALTTALVVSAVTFISSTAAAAVGIPAIVCIPTAGISGSTVGILIHAFQKEYKKTK